MKLLRLFSLDCSEPHLHDLILLLQPTLVEQHFLGQVRASFCQWWFSVKQRDQRKDQPRTSVCRRLKRLACFCFAAMRSADTSGNLMQFSDAMSKEPSATFAL